MQMIGRLTNAILVFHKNVFMDIKHGTSIMKITFGLHKLCGQARFILCRFANTPRTSSNTLELEALLESLMPVVVETYSFKNCDVLTLSRANFVDLNNITQSYMTAGVTNN
ncbi:14856_t:CDS:2, partial [Gigaspora rosea]